MLVPILKVENGSKGSIPEKPMLPRFIPLPLNKVLMAACTLCSKMRRSLHVEACRGPHPSGDKLQHLHFVYKETDAK